VAVKLMTLYNLESIKNYEYLLESYLIPRLSLSNV